MSGITSTHIYDPEFIGHAQEGRNIDGEPMVLASIGTLAVSCNFNLTPNRAIEFGEALIKHGQALRAKAASTEAV